MQAQIPATGVINMVHNPSTLLVYASTNGSAFIDGNLTDVFVNHASGQPVIVTNAQRVHKPLPPFSHMHAIFTNTYPSVKTSDHETFAVAVV